MGGRFTLTGKLNGKVAFLTWEKGKITGGTPAAKKSFRRVAKRTKIVEVPCMEPVSLGGPKKHLKNPFAVYLLMLKALDVVLKVDGDVPKVPSVPARAIS